MLVEKTLERIDPRLPAHIVKTRGHLMEDGNQTLFCVRRLLWNQIETMLDEINANGNGSINFVGNYNQKPNGARNFDQKRNGFRNFQKKNVMMIVLMTKMMMMMIPLQIILEALKL